MFIKWLPWRFILRRLARSHGFLDPIALLSRLRRFTQPAEVTEPVELLRAGVVLHARGLINSRVIQHNLDWVWPFWVERQCDPADPGFIPRAFSITHINLAHRNWTAVGLPDRDALPIVDPRGLVTPHLDGWSLDAWLVTESGRELLPSRAARAVQRLELPGEALQVVTETTGEPGDAAPLYLTQSARVVEPDTLSLKVHARAGESAWLAVALRPYNPEGISFIHKVALEDGRQTWRVDGRQLIHFDTPVERHHVSPYVKGDVHIHLNDLSDEEKGTCDVGMITAAALYAVSPGTPRELTVTVPLEVPGAGVGKLAKTAWSDALAGHTALSVPDARFRFLYDAALATLVLHAPGDVYPGPYTYKRFWFRDAALIIHALLCAGLHGRAVRALDRFPQRQTAGGYFHSQEGEWDANGEVLWIFDRYCRLTGRDTPPAWLPAIRKGARWIEKKRLPDGEGPHAGLLPAGFSAEHLGPADYYYWDDFWGIAGLEAAARMLRQSGYADEADRHADEAARFRTAVDRTLTRVAQRLGHAAMPAAPERRMDPGAIGSLCAGYPLRLYAPNDPRLLATADWLLGNSMAGGGFFQDMIHSGINPYLTLHLAQVLLRAGDSRCLTLMDRVAELASPTGQWPEAIHPITLGGCMGDGQHVWAAAEWVMMVRNAFVREEGDGLVLAAGVHPAWLESEAVSFGPAPTDFGPVTVTVHSEGGGAVVHWDGAWRTTAPEITVHLPGHAPCVAAPGETRVTVQPQKVP